VKKVDADARLTEALSASSFDLLRYLQRRLEFDEAADALAEVMLVAWRRVDSLPRSTEESRMWLFGIARNVTFNAERSARRRLALAGHLRETLRAAPTQGSPADEGAEVRDAISRLSAEHAELVRLVHWDGFSIAEAGAVLGIPASTARTRYQRARTELRSALVSDVTAVATSTMPSS